MKPNLVLQHRRGRNACGRAHRRMSNRRYAARALRNDAAKGARGRVHNGDRRARLGTERGWIKDGRVYSHPVLRVEAERPHATRRTPDGRCAIQVTRVRRVEAVSSTACRGVHDDGYGHPRDQCRGCRGCKHRRVLLGCAHGPKGAPRQSPHAPFPLSKGFYFLLAAGARRIM